MDEVMEKAVVDEGMEPAVEVPAPEVPDAVVDKYVKPSEAGLYEISAQDSMDMPEVPELSVVFPTREAALEVLGYIPHDVVVMYYGEAEPTDEMKKLGTKITETGSQLEKFLKDRSVLSFQSKSIGCKKCGSQLAKEYLKDDFCPLCGNDLRAPSTIEGEAQYRQRIDTMKKELDYLGVCNQIKNGKIGYLLKVV